jgi:hypothetical protein
VVMARRLTAMSSTYSSWHPSTYKGCPLIPIPIELVTEGSIHAGKNYVDNDIESESTMTIS